MQVFDWASPSCCLVDLVGFGAIHRASLLRIDDGAADALKAPAEEREDRDDDTAMAKAPL